MRIDYLINTHSEFRYSKWATTASQATSPHQSLIGIWSPGQYESPGPPLCQSRIQISIPVIELASPKNNSLLSSTWFSPNYSSLSVFFPCSFLFIFPACSSPLITGEFSERCSSVALRLCCHRNSHSLPGGYPRPPLNIQQHILSNPAFADHG